MNAEKIVAASSRVPAKALEEAVRRSMDGSCALADCRVRVFLTELEPWSHWLKDASDLLDDRERAKVSRHLRQQDVRMLTMTYALHRLLLAQALAVRPQDVPIGRDALGRPVLHGHALTTSLSHSEGLAAFAISAAGPVGVDIEPLTRQASMPEIRAHVCHPTEQAAYPHTPAGALSLLALWVRKEALLKAAGVGLGREMASFTAPNLTPVCLEPELEGELVARMLEGGRDCLSAVASRPEAHIDWSWLLPPNDE